MGEVCELVVGLAAKFSNVRVQLLKTSYQPPQTEFKALILENFS